jgi:hypothetical protein
LVRQVPIEPGKGFVLHGPGELVRHVIKPAGYLRAAVPGSVAC